MSDKREPPVREIQARIYALEGELGKLDDLGAGIAAIHVNAAIEQLRSNLSVVNGVVNDNAPGLFDPSLLHQLTNVAVGIHCVGGPTTD